MTHASEVGRWISLNILTDDVRRYYAEFAEQFRDVCYHKCITSCRPVNKTIAPHKNINSLNANPMDEYK